GFRSRHPGRRARALERDARAARRGAFLRARTLPHRRARRASPRAARRPVRAVGGGAAARPAQRRRAGVSALPRRALRPHAAAADPAMIPLPIAAALAGLAGALLLPLEPRHGGWVAIGGRALMLVPLAAQLTALPRAPGRAALCAAP